MKISKRIFFYIILAISIFVALYLLFRKPYVPTPLVLNLKRKLALVNPRFSNYDIRESNSSFTENKSTIYICTRDPKTGKYYSDNTLIYVCLHECAHVMSQDYGHHNEFKNIFNQLINKSIKVGVYNPNIPIPPTYCGIKH